MRECEVDICCFVENANYGVVIENLQEKIIILDNPEDIWKYLVLNEILDVSYITDAKIQVKINNRPCPILIKML